MNTVTESLAVGIRYEQDFYAWTQRQAQLVRQGHFAELDREHLAEEIESMGKAVQRAVGSYLRQTLIHLALLQFSPAVEPRRHWRGEIANFRAELDALLADSPSLRPRLADWLDGQWWNARNVAIEKLAGDLAQELPKDCPFTLEQVLAPSWYPSAEAGR